MTYQSAIKQGFTRLAQIANELKNEIGKKQNTLPEAPAPSQSTSYLASDLTWKVIPEGLDGVNGQDGLNGTDGPSAYDVAVSEGFTGTRAEWVESLLPKDLVVYDWAMTNPSDVGFTPISGSYISNNTLLPSGGDTLPVIPALGPYTLANADTLPTKLKISVPTDPNGIFLIGVQPSGMQVTDDINTLYAGQNISGFILSLYAIGQDTYQISSFTPELYTQASGGIIINGEVTLNFNNGVLTIDGYDGFEYLYSETDNLSICSVDQSGMSLDPPTLTFVATGSDSSAVLPDGWFDGIVYRVTSAGIFNNKQTVVGDFVTVIDNGSDIIVTSSSIMNVKLSLEGEITARKTQAALETQERIAADLAEATTRQNSITTLQNSVSTQVAAVQSNNLRKSKLFTVSIVPYNYDTDSIQNTYYLQNGSWYILSRKFSTEGVNADRFQHIYQWNGNPSGFVVVPDTEFYAALDNYPELFSTPHILNVKNSLYYGRIFKDSMGWTYNIDTALAQAAGANNQPLTDLYSNPADQVVGGYMSLDHLSRIGDVETLAQSNDIRIGDMALQTDVEAVAANVETNRLATVANDASITLLKKVSGQSVNIYNALEKQVGQYLNSSGNGLVPGTGWGCTGFIPVIAGKSYTISSATARRAGLQFFTDTSATAVVAGSYNATTTNVTVVAPVGAKYLVVNLYSTSVTEPAWTQVEEGTVATAYQAYGSITQNPIGMASAIYKDKGRFDGGTFQKLTCTGLNGLQLVHTINCTQPASHDSSRVFNFVSTQFDSKVLHTCGDDAAPYRCNGTTLGANHGYSRTRLTMSSHGKTLIDVGSVWTDGVKEWVIVTIVDTNNICVTARTANTGIVATSGTLTHVSGATDTNAISWTAVSALQWYPMLKNHTLTVLADGKVIDPSVSDSTYFDKLVITQSYELMTKSSIVEWLIARTKTSVDLTEYAAPSNISVSMQYAYNRYGNCTITTDFLATDNVTLQDIMFLQSARLTPAVDGNINYYIPKTLQLTHEDVVYDFAAKVDVSTFAPATRINFTPDRTDANGQLADRVVQLSDNYMYATGYLPILDASPAIRRTNASTKALQLNNNGAKIYMSAVDSTSITSLVAGDYYCVVGYRNYSKKSTTRTDNYMVQSGSGDYYYIDYHTATFDRIQLPVELQGRAFDIVEKSTAVTVLSDIATSSIAVKTTGAGYAVLKFK